MCTEKIEKENKLKIHNNKSIFTGIHIERLMQVFKSHSYTRSTYQIEYTADKKCCRVFSYKSNHHQHDHHYNHCHRLQVDIVIYLVEKKNKIFFLFKSNKFEMQ